ncbi:hypothetical protein pEaSNUABM35_00249 [Erwinia phage pEa_SNUABM_35]|uniref:Uncharacterized protein n=1 Tax=Erwinia phage pEa_SNUABM_35 TaxID=2869557 RepID=A0AAE7XR79_9CAUD|nr:hypothetical protein MPK65_gp249 [Erwinia phage pEa_SNUABM_35]QZE60166.1 hypothetical protein pEaSNUABM35_00249 [Erwinia phage pEa_SNUABM_35]QZE60502.1 hypothetical protein pEaSNUABM36_00249 [Erwinia phage pEa_SNUABM_36]
MSEKQIIIDVIADVASPTEVVFEDGESSNQWLAPFDLRLTVAQACGPAGVPEVNIIGDEDNLRRFLAANDQFEDAEIVDVI